MSKQLKMLVGAEMFAILAFVGMLGVFTFSGAQPVQAQTHDAGDVATDRAALTALYNATDGANWLNNGKWLSNAPMGEWHGVTTDSDGRVTHLSLSRNQLTGEIPAELGGLTNLTLLELYINQLTGPIPSELGSLTNLQRLYLGENQLTGPIPSELDSLTNLQRLYLRENQLTGPIPSELGSLTNLQTLNLSWNQLTGLIPSELGGLTNLTLLELSINQLTGPIPSELGSLTNLTILDLSKNELTGPIPSELGSLTNLQTLNLSDIELTGPIPSELGSLTNLQTLNLHGNQLTGEITAELGNLDSLEQLYLSTNQLTGEIPARLGNLTNLEVLRLRDNRLTGSIPAELGSLSNLEWLWLDGNSSLSGPLPGSFTSLTSLTYLSFSGTGLCAPTDAAFQAWLGRIADRPGVVNCAADPLVARYDANGNGTIERGEVIAAINDYLFGGAISRRDVIRLINLYLFGPSTPHNRPGAPEGLTAAGNGQTRIDLSWSAPASDGGAAITGYRIEVSENGSTWTDLVANTRNAATSYSHTGLTAGSTRHYRVSAINSAGMGPASNIATGTTATSVGDAATDRAALTALYNATDGANWRNNGNWLSNAPMGEWHRVTTDSDGRVTQLVLYDNQLTGDMPAELGSLTNLEFLSLYDNQLTGDMPAELGSLTNLQTLDLADNQLTGEIPAELGSLTDLTHLFLDSNQLTGEIPAELGNLINLEILYLDSNQLTGEIPAELGNLINLESLYLTNNQLVGCIPEELRNVPYNDLDQLGLDYCSGNQAPDLVASVTSVGGGGTLYVGESFTINAEVYNQGTGPAASTNLRYYRSTDSTISTSDTLVGTNPVRSLEVSGSSTETISRPAPSRTGTYYYGVCVDPVAGESDTRNNCSGAFTAMVLERTSPDLVASVTSVGDAGILYVGESFTINAVVHNQGTGPAASTNLRYYRSTDRTISTSDTLVGTNPVRSLEVSGSSTETISRTAPSSAGDYYYGVCVDSVAGESDTRNNCSGGYRTEVLQRTSPDLVASVTSVGDAGILYVGESFTINAVVHNQGTGPSASTTLRYYRSTDRTISTSDARIGTDPVDPVPVSGTRAESLSRTAPSRTGTYYYGVCVDQVAGESNTRNNCSGAFTAMVLERTSPDLVASVTSVGDAGILYVGEPFTINAEVYNQGTGPAASTTLRYYRSTNRTISTSDTLVGTDPVDPVPVSETRAESLSRTAPSSTGTYYYGVCVVPVAGESDTRNNCSGGYRTSVLERGSPDLVVQSSRVSDSSLDSGQSFTFSATVRNQGDGQAASTTLRYYRSPNPSISSQLDIEVDTHPVGSLPASSTSPESVGLTAPLDGGTYYYGACVDTVPGESNLHNNCSSGVRVTVTEVSPDLVVIRPLLRDERGLAAPLTSGISVDPGAPFTLYATAHNQGDVPSNSTTLRYYRSNNDTISTGDTPVGTDSVGSLSANAISSEWIDLYAPSTPGTHYYGSCVDSVSGESDTGNNCSDAVEVTVPPAWVTHKECTHTSNLFGRTYTLTGTVVASRSVSNVTITGYIVRYTNEREVNRERVGEYDFGTMSANRPENFEMSKFFLFNIFEHQGCDFEFEWEY